MPCLIFRQIYSGDADISHIQKFAVIRSVCGVHSVSGFHGGKISLIWASQKPHPHLLFAWISQSEESLLTERMAYFRSRLN